LHSDIVDHFKTIYFDHNKKSNIFIKNYPMKKLLFAMALMPLLFFHSTIKAQKVFIEQYESNADVKVYVVQYASDADLKVYKEQYESNAGQNDGKWFFEEYESNAKKKIFLEQYESNADLKIYFVDYESDAGWVNDSKKYLMY